MQTPHLPRELTWSQERISGFWNSVELCHLAEQSFAKNAGDALIDLVSRHLDSGCRILDFGAGNGWLTEKLLARGYQVAVHEPSQERYAKLIERVGAHPNFLGEISPESVQLFDVVFLVEVIEHIFPHDLKAVLQSAVRLLARSGKLIVTTPNNEALQSSKVLCPACNQLFHPWQHLSSFSVDRLAEQLVPLEVHPVQVVLADFSQDAETIEHLKKSQHTINRLDLSLSELSHRLEVVNKRFGTLFSQIPHCAPTAFGEESADFDLFSYKASPEVKDLTSLMAAHRLQSPLRRLVMRLRLMKNVFNVIAVFLRDLSDQRARALGTLNDFRVLTRELQEIHSDYHGLFTRAQNAPISNSADEGLVHIGKESTIVLVGALRRDY